MVFASYLPPSFSTIKGQPSFSQSSPRTSVDQVLTALTQLATLRLDATRALVSLFDSNSQYFIAEATPTSSLHPAEVSGQQQSPWLCGTAVARPFGICDRVVAPSSEHSTERASAGGVSNDFSLPIFVIHDILDDKHFADRPFVQRYWSRCRFYAGIPLRTRRGIDIGVLCILDAKPRNGLDGAEMRFLRELSDTVMGHLDANRISYEQRRTERMVRGMDSFIEGATCLTGWHERPKLYSFKSYHGKHSDTSTSLSRVQGTDPYPGRFSAVIDAGTLCCQNYAEEGSETAVHGSTHMDTSNVAHCSTLSGSELQHADAHTVPSRGFGDDDSASKVNRVFSRAANILREAIEVDGVLFLEASAACTGADLAASDNAEQTSGASSSSEESSSVTASNGASANFCPLLASSTNCPSSTGVPNMTTTMPARILRKLLRRYPRGKVFNFDENGLVLSSDNSGEETHDSSHSSQHYTSRNGKTWKLENNTRARRGVYETLADICPGARCIGFAPVWDQQNNRWYAGAFAYTKASTRLFSARGELSYLNAFGSVAMTEVSRLKAAIAERSKMDMLSSLSHELRSPLHGVILGLETLQDGSAPLKTFHKEVLQTAEMCSRTLLDTVDHLLDWTKINSLTPSNAHRRNSAPVAEERGRHRSEVGTKTPAVGLATSVPLDVLIEEVAESCFAGHTYRILAVTQFASATQDFSPGLGKDVLLRLDGAQAALDNGKMTHMPRAQGDVGPVVTIDIDAAEAWTVFTDPGAIRRIIMNLLGNSLKYTPEGFIRLIVSQRPGSLGRKPLQRGTQVICVTVTDSGRGISRDFLKNHLFIPFTQEDRLSPGVGLGLSLVRRIASKLGGRVQVQSKVGRGTTVSVEIPVGVPVGDAPPSSWPGTTGEASHEFAKQVNDLKGLSVCLTGFRSGMIPTGDIPGSTAQRDEYDVMASICRDWLAMQVLEHHPDPMRMADIVICRHGEEAHAMRKGLTTLASLAIIVICHDVTQASDMASKAAEKQHPWPCTVEFISQPYVFISSFLSLPNANECGRVGPRKLARTIVASLRRRKHTLPSNLSADLTPPAELDQIADTLKLTRVADAPDCGSETYCGDISTVFEATGTPAPSLAQGSPIAQHSLEAQFMTGHQTRSETEAFLLVDDNPVNLGILSAFMRRLGQPHDLARNGQEAVDKFHKRAGAYKCIIMDISMPVLDGFTATRLIRQHEKQTGTRPSSVIALTGLASADAQRDATACGVDVFLVKPLKFAELTRILMSRGLIHRDN